MCNVSPKHFIQQRLNAALEYRLGHICTNLSIFLEDHTLSMAACNNILNSIRLGYARLSGFDLNFFSISLISISVIISIIGL